jgi:hypothetical protein
VKGTSHPPAVAQVMLRLDGRVRVDAARDPLGGPTATTCGTACRRNWSPGT